VTTRHCGFGLLICLRHWSRLPYVQNTDLYCPQNRMRLFWKSICEISSLIRTLAIAAGSRLRRDCLIYVPDPDLEGKRLELSAPKACTDAEIKNAKDGSGLAWVRAERRTCASMRLHIFVVINALLLLSKLRRNKFMIKSCYTAGGRRIRLFKRIT